ncbi:MAG: malonyl-CoA decarboxylase [Motiliproteus sp.]
MQESANGILDKTIRRLVPLWRDAQGSRRILDKLSLNPDLGTDDARILLKWMDACLADDGGEVAARVRAATLGRSFLALNKGGRIRFLTLLADNYSTDEAAVEVAIERWMQADSQQRTDAGLRLRHALEPPRMKLLTQFNELPEGIKFLVDMRAELLSLKKDHPNLSPLEADLKRLLSAWFDVGLLQLEQISWQSSAELLEKLIAYEAVHAIQGWGDLKNRLNSDRRCFAFFHPNMPNEPLIFVEVALVNGLADNVQQLLDEEVPVLDIGEADTAIFYSISNAQKGLAGISFGNFLIKRVVKQLQHEFPHLKHFSTLSPIPGFNRWLEHSDDDQLRQLPGGKAWLDTPKPRRPNGKQTAVINPELSEGLLSLASHYLYAQKRNSTYAMDPVAHFHLSNGAQIARLNWMADSSDKGLRQASGMMVNYLYELPKIESRSQQYTSIGDICLSTQLKKRLKKPR